MQWKNKHVIRRLIPVDLMETHRNVPLNGYVHHDVTGREHDKMPHVNMDATLRMWGQVTKTTTILDNGG